MLTNMSILAEPESDGLSRWVSAESRKGTTVFEEAFFSDMEAMTLPSAESAAIEALQRSRCASRKRSLRVSTTRTATRVWADVPNQALLPLAREEMAHA